MSARILTGLAVLAFLALGAFAGYFLWLADRAPAGPLNIQLGEVRLSLPPGYVREVDQRRSGEFSELEIAVAARDFRPAPRPRKLQPGMEDASEGIIYITLRPQEKTLDPAERTARLYVRFLEQEEWSHPGALVMRRFEEGSPFGREDLYMAPPEGRAFAARCIRPQQPPDGLPNTCISEVRYRGLDIRLRFSPNLLSEWESFMAGARGLIDAFAK